MVKVRLHGTREELNHATKCLERLFNVFSISEPYPDRGNSSYCRVYIDVDFSPLVLTGSVIDVDDGFVQVGGGAE